MEFTQLDNDGKPVPGHPQIDMEIVSVNHTGIELLMFMQRMEGSEPKFARLLTPPPDKTPDGYLDAVMDYMENTLGFGNILALDVLDAARVCQREHAERGAGQSEHINADGEFQSDKYPWCKPGFVPMKITDEMAQSLLWDYSIRREAVDKQFSEDLRTCLKNAGHPGLLPPAEGGVV